LWYFGVICGRAAHDGVIPVFALWLNSVARDGGRYITRHSCNVLKAVISPASSQSHLEVQYNYSSSRSSSSSRAVTIPQNHHTSEMHVHIILPPVSRLCSTEMMIISVITLLSSSQTQNTNRYANNAETSRQLNTCDKHRHPLRSRQKLPKIIGEAFRPSRNPIHHRR
jgi:hypothetical protein